MLRSAAMSAVIAAKVSLSSVVSFGPCWGLCLALGPGSLLPPPLPLAGEGAQDAGHGTVRA